jgi:hypothetical protein
MVFLVLGAVFGGEFVIVTAEQRFAFTEFSVHQ